MTSGCGSVVSGREIACRVKGLDSTTSTAKKILFNKMGFFYATIFSYCFLLCLLCGYIFLLIWTKYKGTPAAVKAEIWWRSIEEKRKGRRELLANRPRKRTRLWKYVVCIVECSVFYEKKWSFVHRNINVVILLNLKIFQDLMKLLLFSPAIKHPQWV